MTCPDTLHTVSPGVNLLISFIQLSKTANGVIINCHHQVEDMQELSKCANIFEKKDVHVAPESQNPSMPK